MDSLKIGDLLFDQEHLGMVIAVRTDHYLDSFYDIEWYLRGEPQLHTRMPHYNAIKYRQIYLDYHEQK